MYQKRFRLLIIFTLVFCMTACVKDKPNPGNNNSGDSENAKMFVANEGVFNGGNASLSFIDLKENTIHNDIFNAKNNRLLGDVLQSITADDVNLYLVVNNSNKIVIIDKKTYEYKGEIAVTQPRYMVLLGNNKALVSSMYVSKLFVVDIDSKSISREIQVPFANTEGMVSMGNKIYICPWDTHCNYIYQFDKTSAQIEDSIYIAGFAPTQAVVDKHNKLWVFAGNPYLNTSSSITQLDVENKQILKSFQYSGTAELIKPIINPSKDIIYYLGVMYNSNNNDDYNGLYQLPIEANSLPTQALVKAQSLQYFWGLGVNPQNGNIFIGDPKGFIQSGMVTEYTRDGVLLRSYDVGLGPGFFHFEEE